MEVTYSILIPKIFGKILGATKVVENGFIPPSRDYRVIINDEVSLAIDDGKEALQSDLKGNVFVQLYPDIYIIEGEDFNKESYDALCEDLDGMVKDGWTIIYEERSFVIHEERLFLIN